MNQILLCAEYAERSIVITSIQLFQNAPNAPTALIPDVHFIKIYILNKTLVFYGIVLIAVFMILGISMGLSINKIKDDNIIETLKEDAV